MKKLFISLSLMASCLATIILKAQTNPSAVSLPFSLNSQTSSALPAGIAVHRFSSIPSTRTLLSANGGDLPNQGSSSAATAGGWYHLSADGIGLLSSGTNPAGAIVLAINTTSLSGISVSWLCKTIKNQSSRDNSVALQYRVGTTGNFIDVGTTSTYASTGNADGHTSAVFTETLPAAANNQSVVQVRWIYWESVSTSGSRDKISIDNININGTANGACNNPSGLSVFSVTNSAASFSWLAVPGASSYQYSLTTSSTPPVSGVTTTATSYTAAGLAAGTSYYFHLRSACSATNFSSWTLVSFSTAASSSTTENEFVLMSYNLLNYPGTDGASREPSYRTIMDSVQPDILVVQEISSSTGIGNFLTNVLNFSSSNYSQGTFINGPDSDNGLYYRTSKFQFISNTPFTTDLRDINQFKLKHTSTGDTLIIFSVHLKASNTKADEAQRTLEVDSLRKITNSFASGKNFIVCGDFNIYSSSETAYQNLIGNGSNPNGKFNDILSMTGTWNNSAYAIHHTQSPRTTAFGGGATGGLDDRFDMILFSNAIIQSGGIDLVTNSYRVYGNDGAHYNQALNIPPYSLYSSITASALHDASDHLPVIVKLKAIPTTQKPLQVSEVFKTAAEGISIYPNPAFGTLFIKTDKAFTETLTFEFFNSNGILLVKKEMTGNSGEHISFEVADLAAGIYYLRSPQLKLAQKVIIEK